MHRAVFWAALASVVLSGASCKLFDVEDAENVKGRGPQAFDPYESIRSGAVRLSLQRFNGCAVLPTGETVGKGSAPIPYPDHCGTDPFTKKATRPIPLAAGTRYFLNQLSFAESVYNQANDPQRLHEVPAWALRLQPFGRLDWGGLGLTRNLWWPSRRSPSPYAWYHQVQWTGATWMEKQDDTFLLEVIDSDGTVRGSLEVSRKDFMVSNPASGHTSLMWEQDNIAAPKYPGDPIVVAAPPAPPEFPPTMAPLTQNMFRFEIVSSFQPQNNLVIDESLRGDGAIRITWSQLPADPFYFPVTFTNAAEQVPTCRSGTDGTQVPCTFGLFPEATFSTPKNGQVYVPGETLQISLSLKDANGSLLHPPYQFPSWNEYRQNQANGILYYNLHSLLGMGDHDMITSFTVAGPKQAMSLQYELSQREYFQTPTDQFIKGPGNIGTVILGDPLQANDAIPGIRDVAQPTLHTVTLPLDAKPGTYVLYWKAHRFFMGERSAKMVPIEFQVGQTERTQFPGSIGNCQICHRGVVSMENIRHGVDVDQVEGCKSCHSRDAFTNLSVSAHQMVHEIHMNSSKYPRAKNDCTICHLKRETTVRPSYVVCASCHPTPHGGAYEALSTQNVFDPTTKGDMFGNCANACHVLTTPAGHVLPPLEATP